MDYELISLVCITSLWPTIQYNIVVYTECTFPVFFNGFNVFNFFWSSALKLAVNISNDVQNRPQWVKNSEKLYGLSNVNNNIKMLLFLDGTGR